MATRKKKKTEAAKTKAAAAGTGEKKEKKPKLTFKERMARDRARMASAWKAVRKFFHSFTADGRYQKMVSSKAYAKTQVSGMVLVLQESGQSVKTVERAQKAGRILSLIVTYAFILFMALVVLFPSRPSSRAPSFGATSSTFSSGSTSSLTSGTPSSSGSSRPSVP